MSSITSLPVELEGCCIRTLLHLILDQRRFFICDGEGVLIQQHVGLAPSKARCAIIIGSRSAIATVRALTHASTLMRDRKPSGRSRYPKCSCSINAHVPFAQRCFGRFEVLDHALPSLRHSTRARFPPADHRSLVRPHSTALSSDASDRRAANL